MKHTILIILFFFNCLNTYSQEFTKLYDKYLGGTKVDKPISLVKTIDNGVVIIGISNSTDGTLAGLVPNTSVNRVVLIKLSNTLDLVWAKAFNYTSCSTIENTTENGFCFVGRNSSNLLEFVKLDEFGNQTTNTNLNIPYTYNNENIILKKSADNGFFLGLHRNIYLYGTDWDVDFYKLSSTGNILWNKTISGSADEKIVDFFVDASGNVVVFGNTNSEGGDIKRIFTNLRNRNTDIMMVYLDKNNGGIIKQKSIGGSQEEKIYSVCKISDEKYVFISLVGSVDGGIEIFNGNCCDNGIFAVDANGTILWQKPTGATEYSTITVDTDGKLLVNSQGTYRKFTQDGVFLWNNTPTGFFVTSYTKVFTIPFANNEYISIGTKSYYVSPYLQDNIYVVKYKREKPKIDVSFMSKNVVCYNDKVTMEIDTVGVFASNNIFTVKATYPYTGATYTLYTGSNTNFELTAPTLGTYTVNQTSEFQIQVSSSNPVTTSLAVNLRVQTPTILNLSSTNQTVNRGVIPNINLGVGYIGGPHRFKVNDQIYSTYQSDLFVSKIPNKSSYTFNVQEYSNTCGTVPLNITHVFNITDDTPTQVWQYSIGGGREENLGGAVVTSDGGYVVAGSTASTNGDSNGFKGGQNDGIVVKFNAFGNIVWKRNYGGTSNDYIQAIKQTLDGGYIFAGFTASGDGDLAFTTDESYKHGWITKINSSGQIQWTRKYGIWRPNYSYYYQEYLQDVIEVNGGYVVVGTLDNYFGIRKIDINGNELWLKLLGSDNGYNVAYSVDKDNQGNLYVVGTGANFQTGYRGGNTDIYFAKLSTNGTVLNSRYLGGNNNDYANKIKCTSDGGAIIVGSTYSTSGDIYSNYGSEDICIFKINSTASLEWGQNYGSSSTDRAYDVAIQNDGYLVSGHFNNNDGNVMSSIGYLSTLHNQNLCLIKISNSGGRVWQKVLGGTGNVGFYKTSVAVFSNGNLLLATNTNESLGDVRQKKGNSDVWVCILGSALLCEENLNITQAITTSENYNRNISIGVSASIENNANVVLKAGNNIQLSPGFKTASGVIFRAEIATCTNEN